MNLFKNRISKIIRAIKEIGIDGNIAILRSKESLTYLFAEIYNPPPEEVSIFTSILHLDTFDIDIYVSALDFYRVEEIYGVKGVNIYPVASRDMGLDLGVDIIDHEKLNSIIHEYIKKNRIIMIDEPIHCPDSICIDIKGLIRRCRRSKDQAEADIIGKAVRITERALDSILSEIVIGIDEKTIAALIEKKAREFGADGFAFGSIVAIGVNTSKPHHIPTLQRFTGREPILIDFGVRIQGYVSDITRMIIPNKLGEEYNDLEDNINIIDEAIDEALKVVGQDTICKNIDYVARDVLKKRGLDKYFLHGLGHGIGIDVHEEPRLSPRSDHKLINGDVITIEPGIYIKGRYGIRIEEDIYVTLNTYKKLTTLTRVLRL